MCSKSVNPEVSSRQRISIKHSLRFEPPSRKKGEGETRRKEKVVSLIDLYLQINADDVQLSRAAGFVYLPEIKEIGGDIRVKFAGDAER
jgi:activator of HSP90 ATPase